MATQIGVSAHTQSLYSKTRTIPINEGLFYNFTAANRAAGIRRNDLLLLTRRIVPRPLATRDNFRPYQTVVGPRKEYFSEREAKFYRNFARLDPHPLDTRRDNYTISST
jgi:hypothetical protein